MFKFEYEIKINESDGIPYINPINETSNELGLLEHKFMGLEITRYVFRSLIELHLKDQKKWPISESEFEKLKYLDKEITNISYTYALALRDQNSLINNVNVILNKNFDITVLDEEERDNLNYNGIIFDDKIFKRVEGLKVKIITTGEVYELKGGIDNQHWTKI